jgi:hypothetical protein
MSEAERRALNLEYRDPNTLDPQRFAAQGQVAWATRSLKVSQSLRPLPSDASTNMS